MCFGKYSVGNRKRAEARAGKPHLLIQRWWKWPLVLQICMNKNLVTCSSSLKETIILLHLCTWHKHNLLGLLFLLIVSLHTIGFKSSKILFPSYPFWAMCYSATVYLNGSRGWKCYKSKLDHIYTYCFFEKLCGQDKLAVTVWYMRVLA